MGVFRRKGLVALDIDGTITAQAHEIDDKVIDALNQIEKSGWSIIFITGRSFGFAHRLLQSFPFPYVLATQNGALIVQMPEQKKISGRSLPISLVSRIQAIGKRPAVEGVLYVGGLGKDRCYYFSSFPKKDLAYALKRAQFLGEEWTLVGSLEELLLTEVASVKFFVPQESAALLSRALEEELGLHAPPNRDPYDSSYFVVQATDPLANKGEALRQYAAFFPEKPFIIAAGDDYNDLSMLEVASLKIVMENAPQALLERADIIAPAASKCGIVDALFQAIEHK